MRRYFERRGQSGQASRTLYAHRRSVPQVRAARSPQPVAYRRSKGSLPLSYLAPSPTLAPPTLPPRAPVSRARVTAPIFLSGCNRGGTTLVTRLLATHPEVVDIGTGQFDEGQYIWRQKYPDWSRHRWAVPP